MRKLCLALFIMLLLFLHVASADVIVNSQDWRDVYLVTLYAKFKGEDVHYILNLGETDILMKSLPKNVSYEIFESVKKPAIKNLKQFMSNYEFSMLTETTFNDYNDLQILLYNAVKGKIKGFIVINPKFGYDAISVFPLAEIESRWVLFYNKNYKHRVLSLLKSDAKKPVIFYGEFLSQPWEKISNHYEIIYALPSERNKEIVKRVWKKLDGWVVVTSGNYIEKGFLTEGKPILLIRDSPETTTKFLKKLGVKLVEVIGPENVNFGHRIRELSNRTIGVVAKVARTFTGNVELRGKIYALPVKPVDTEVHNFTLEKILWDKNRLVLVLKNNGNVKEFFRINAIRAIGKEEYPLADYKTHVAYPGETVSIPFYGNFSSLKQVETLITYGNEKLIYGIRNQTTGGYFFSTKFYQFPEIKQLKILGIFYDPLAERLLVEVNNPNKQGVWARAEIYNFTFLGKKIILASENVKIEPGTSHIPISIYLSKKDIENNKNLSVLVFYGPSKGIFSGYVTFSQKKPISKITGYFVWLKENRVIIAVSFLAIAILILLIIFFKRRKRKKRRNHRG